MCEVHTLTRAVCMLRFDPWFLLSVGLSLAACSGGGREGEETAVPFQEDVLTPVWTIGREPLEEAFQIAYPEGIAVDAAGRVYVADRENVKVFDPEGRPLAVLGRKGSGPGEFERARSPLLGPTGLLAVPDQLQEANLFGEQGAFLRRFRYLEDPRARAYIQEQGFGFHMLNSLLPLDGERLLVDQTAIVRELEGPFVRSDQLLYFVPDGLNEVCRYLSRNQVRFKEGGDREIAFQGLLLWTPVRTDGVVYMQTGFDRELDETDPRYHLIRVTLATMARDTLRIPWEPLAIPAACRRLRPLVAESIGLVLPVTPEMQDIMDRTPFYPPAIRLLADADQLFVFAHSVHDSAGVSEEEREWDAPRTADLIELSSGRLTARAGFPFLPDLIRDGYVYRMVRPRAELPRIEKYRLKLR